MEFVEYIRKPFSVNAIEITEENMKEVAKLIGTVRTKDGVTFIALDRRIIPNVTRAFVGWYLTCVDNNYRCYAPKLFRAQFVERPKAEGEWDSLLPYGVDSSVVDEDDLTPPHGIPRPSLDG